MKVMDKLLPIAGRDHIRGGKQAPVSLLEYGDYECPYCGKAYYIIDKLIGEVGDMFSFAFRNFPLVDAHPNAMQAALAAEAASLQGKFWEMYAMLFENQSLLGDDYILAYAEEVGLDLKKFLKDMGSDEAISRVEEDLISGAHSGANSTPSFFINGQRYNGPYDYGILKQVIEAIAADSPYREVKYDYGLSHSVKK
jgi:protein-disulfide isomerase